MRIIIVFTLLIAFVSCKKESMNENIVEDDRIWFKGNPWPEGHPIKKFKWSSEVRDGVVWFHMHLESEDYYSERDLYDPEPTEHDSDWEAPIVWGNYHSCTISSSKWHNGGFPVCSVEEYSLDYLDGHVAIVDPLPISSDADLDELAFHTYLLGHDSVAGHSIRFVRRSGSDRFDIIWDGKIALVYAGDYDYRYNFNARISDVVAPDVIK
ncbi:hypothetical protein JIN77_16690 [Verrucomicrobiaceae bacterium R5-34]|uniref:Uncharacterized protein n=1 Tax=Oceaniferula flava TaxID=2800421 RepID=A0AAE2VAD1_9BACT|nr:hypothetical protein [Oceaniferula flavus]MBK1832378.1 hypothetical protein [Verrucomicrobiaceae bacterium R5-34]MBK1856588.1 hypothetical protein [Oceaniferula flavus]MBM1137896.1 hypothetical protein [Oceaniferula flavus]